MSDETLVYFGGPVKALGNGKVGGYLVRFSDETTPDLCGDYFNKSTDFYIEPGDSRFVLYDHGFDKTLGRSKIGKGVVAKIDDVGLWVEAQLGIRASYEKAVDDTRKKKLVAYGKSIYKLAEDGKLGWSSGAASHMVDRVKSKDAFWLSQWGITEFSLTPCPAEPQNTAVTLKSVAHATLDLESSDDTPEPKSLPSGSLAAKLTRFIIDLTDDGRSREDIVKSLAREAMMDTADVEKVLDGETPRPTNQQLKAFGRALSLPYKTLKELADKSAPKSIKDLFTEELAGRTPSTWELQSVYCCVVKKIAEAAKSARAVGTEYDYAEQVEQATAAYLAELKAAVSSQVGMYVEGEGMEEFYLRSLSQLTQDDFAAFSKGTDLEDHSQLVVTAVRDITTRLRSNHEARKSQKAGRVLSEKNRTRLTKLVEQMQAAVTECQSLLDESKPMASEAEMRKALANSLRLKFERREHQLGA